MFLCKFVIEMIGKFLSMVNFNDYVFKIIYFFIWVFVSYELSLRVVVFDMLCVFMLQLGCDYLYFEYIVYKIILIYGF